MIQRESLALVVAALLVGCTPGGTAARQDPAPAAPAPAPQEQEIRVRAKEPVAAPRESEHKLSVPLAELKPNEDVTLFLKVGAPVEAQFVVLDGARLHVTITREGIQKGATYSVQSLRDVVRGHVAAAAPAAALPTRYVTFEVLEVSGAPGAEVEVLALGSDLARDAVDANRRGGRGFKRSYLAAARPAVRLVLPSTVLVGNTPTRGWAIASEGKDVEPGANDLVFADGGRARVAVTDQDVERQSGADATQAGAAALAPNVWREATVQVDGDMTDWWALELAKPAQVALYAFGKNVEVRRQDETAPDVKTPWQLPAGRHLIRVRALAAGPALPYALFAATGETPLDLELARLGLAFEDVAAPVRRLDARDVRDILAHTTPGQPRIDLARQRLKDPRAAVRRLACQALAVFRDRESFDTLTRLAELDEDPNVRLAARAAADEVRPVKGAKGR